MKVIQITDTHLFAQDNLEIFGEKSNLRCQEVIARIVNEESDNTDLILLTGDVSQDKTAESYQKMVHYLSGLGIPVYWIPGNHDDLEQMKQAFDGAKNFHYQTHLTLEHWHLIFINTTKNNTDKGYLSLQERLTIKKELEISPTDKKIAMVMHHHPVEVGTPLVDHYILQDTNEFWSLLTQKPVDLIICGHVHGNYQIKYNNLVIETSPATCLQWEKGATELKIERKIGYKIYYFERNTYKAKAKIW
jgi:Icc protein